MIPIMIVILILIALVFIFFRTSPTEVFRLNTTCKKCGAKKGILKCRDCGV